MINPLLALAKSNLSSGPLVDTSQLLDFSGCTFIAYDNMCAPCADALVDEGFDTFRFISHDQTARWNNGDVVHTPWMLRSTEYCNAHGGTYWYTMTIKSCPIDIRDARNVPTDWGAWYDWFVQTLTLLIDNLDNKVIWIEVGNEFESSGSEWTVDEHKFLYSMTLAARNYTLTIRPEATLYIGGVAHVDYNKYDRFVEITNYVKSLHHDFVSAHFYGTSTNALAWLDTIMDVAGDSPVVITEDGIDFRSSQDLIDASIPQYTQQQIGEWRAAFLTRCKNLGVSKVFCFLGYPKDLPVTPWLAELAENPLLVAPGVTPTIALNNYTASIEAPTPIVLSVTASNYKTLQWTETTAGALSGETGTELIIDPSVAGSYGYSCIASNDGLTAQSAVAAITVDPIVFAITTQPVRITTVVEPAPVTLFIVATGATSYQWLVDFTTEMVGETTDTLNIDPTVAGSRRYSCRISDGVNFIYSSPAFVNVTT